MSYGFITAYMPFFHAFRQFDQTREHAGESLWVINENRLRRFPAAARTLLGRRATSKMFVQSLHAAPSRGERGLLHPMDWRIVVEEPIGGGYRSTWAQSMANLMGLPFTRAKTLADGDDCYSNDIVGPGFTEWAPEKGFLSRK